MTTTGPVMRSSHHRESGRNHLRRALVLRNGRVAGTKACIRPILRGCHFSPRDSYRYPQTTPSIGPPRQRSRRRYTFLIANWNIESHSVWAVPQPERPVQTLAAGVREGIGDIADAGSGGQARRNGGRDSLGTPTSARAIATDIRRQRRRLGRRASVPDAGTRSLLRIGTSNHTLCGLFPNPSGRSRRSRRAFAKVSAISPTLDLGVKLGEAGDAIL